MEKEIKPGDVIGSMQTNAYHGTTDGTAPTITAACGMGGGQTPMIVEETTDWRIRKLTERECFRLMDMDDADIDKIRAAKIPKTQQYKLAGNSIVVSCLYHLFRKLLVEKQCESQWLQLF